MSSVKLCIPTLSINLIEFLGASVKIYDCTVRSYKTICNVIFQNYGKISVILIGKIDFELPISPYCIRKTVTKSALIKCLQSTNTQTFGGFKLLNAPYMGDTYRLWMYGRNLTANRISVAALYKKIYGDVQLSEIMIWGQVKLREFKNNPQHAKRIAMADLSYPIYVYRNIILDGTHRFIKAILEKKKTILIYIVTPNIIRLCEIKNFTSMEAYRNQFKWRV